MAMPCQASANEPYIGPISQHQSNQSYLNKHRLNQVFECMMAGLMIECPTDCLVYLDHIVGDIQNCGLDPVTKPYAFDKFIKHLHPTNHMIHKAMIRTPRPSTPATDKKTDIEKDFIIPFSDPDYFLQDVEKKIGFLPFGDTDYFTQDLDKYND